MLSLLPSLNRLFVKQVFELAEIFGFESRNKYRITDEVGRDIGYAAEQNRGWLQWIFRQWLGHWRAFEIHFFGVDRREALVAQHPFRWFFQCLVVREFEGGRPLGVVERRWSFLRKSFDVQNANGQVILEMRSPILSFWTFPFFRAGREVARIGKKWSGVGYEMFTDRDNFMIEYKVGELNQDERALVLVAAIYVDILYFEKKGSGSYLNND